MPSILLSMPTRYARLNVEYLDQGDIRDLRLAEDSVYVYGTLQIHHVKRLSINTVEFRYNSPYKVESKLLKQVIYDDDDELDTGDLSCAEIPAPEEVQLPLRPSGT